MSEVLFYQLDRRPLESVLPELLEKCLERNWRTVLQVGSEERLAALDAHLWTYGEESFLPHGTAKDGRAEAQPIYLTTGGENPNGATVRLLADGAEFADVEGRPAESAWTATVRRHDDAVQTPDDLARVLPRTCAMFLIAATRVLLFCFSVIEVPQTLLGSD